MGLVVMKFGGSSLSDSTKIKRVAGIIVLKKKEGNKIVAVVSAPGDMTDDLIKMAHSISQSPPPREMDMLLATGEMVSISLLSMAIRNIGESVISMTGAQAGIFVSNNHMYAKIKNINPQKINDKLVENNIVIIAGFQGINPIGDIATLGRGGSDLTAVALSASLKSDLCEIYSDVDGVYTADPRIVINAKKIDYISYNEMLEMSGSGSQVLQLRSVEVAKKYNVNIHSRGTFSKNDGTIITSDKKIKEKGMESFLLSGISLDKNQAKFTISVLNASDAIIADIFNRFSKINVNIDMFNRFIFDKNNIIYFIVNRCDVEKIQKEFKKTQSDYNVSIFCNEHVAKVSIVGIGVKNHFIIAKILEILHKNNISIDMISMSEIKISCILDEFCALNAVEKLHNGLEFSKK
ncbi:MAG: aspartate kinase [Endomicrobium sp.]|jgi:aspartate kinase|nr:aspartate kinase [Endomicrobium sp.]